MIVKNFFISLFPLESWSKSFIWNILWSIVIFSLWGIVTLNLLRTRTLPVEILIEKGVTFIQLIEAVIKNCPTFTEEQLQPIFDTLVSQQGVACFVLTTPMKIIFTDNSIKQEQLYPPVTREKLYSIVKSVKPTHNYSWNILEIEGNEVLWVYKNFTTNNSKKTTESLEQLFTIFVGLDPNRFIPVQEAGKNNVLFFILNALGYTLLTLLSCIYLLKQNRKIQKIQLITTTFIDELTSAATEGIIIFDVEGSILLINNAAKQLLNINENKSKGCSDILENSSNEYLPEPFNAIIEKLYTEKRLEKTEIMIGEKPHCLVVSGVDMIYPDNNQIGYILFMQDVTDIRILEKEVQRREQLITIGSIASGVAHELRNPLSSIKGYASYLGERFATESTEHEVTRIIVQEVERLNRVVSELIGLSLPTDIRPENINLGSVIKDVLRLIEQDAKKQAVEFNFNIDHTLYVSVDPDRIRQVLLNLCLNALEAMPQGGKLTITLYLDQAKQQFSLEIKDTGVGISKNVLSQIFDPYFSTKVKGTGLGLAIVQKIVVAHKGSITVDSELGKGTVFRLVFPTNEA